MENRSHRARGGPVTDSPQLRYGVDRDPPDTGAEVWRFAEEFDTRTLFDTHYLVRIGSNADPDEHLVQVYDPAAGELITTGLLPVVRSVESQLIGSLLLFVHRTDGAVQVSGYDVTTFTH